MSDLESAGYYFFLREKYLMVHFRGRFLCGQDIFDLKIVPSVARDNFVVKNVETTSKSPEKLRH